MVNVDKLKQKHAERYNSIQIYYFFSSLYLFLFDVDIVVNLFDLMWFWWFSLSFKYIKLKNNKGNNYVIFSII